MKYKSSPVPRKRAGHLTPALCAALLLAAAALILYARSAHSPLPIVRAAAPASPQWAGTACTPPFQMASTPEETAWRLWVAATCPINSNQYPYIVWENWIEQAQMFPANAAHGLARFSAPHRLHGSPLARVVAARNNKTGGGLFAPNDSCNAANNPPPGQKLTICEEVRLNGVTQDWISATNLWNRPGQAAVATAGGTIEFPPPSVEIKADWILLPSCANPPSGVHVEQIQGQCYALAGMHLISKLMENWIWATFEPQNLSTNPSRCVELGCNDPWGSNPAQSSGGAGGNTQLTASLASLMDQANLAPEWRNYRLDGVQVNFVDSSGNATILGNSIIEGENVGMPMKQASCITCHAVSSVKNDGTDGITLLTSNFVGNPPALPDSSWIRRDFLWSLGDACPNAAFQSCGAKLGAGGKRHHRHRR